MGRNVASVAMAVDGGELSNGDSGANFQRHGGDTGLNESVVDGVGDATDVGNLEGAGNCFLHLCWTLHQMVLTCSVCCRVER